MNDKISESSILRVAGNLMSGFELSFSSDVSRPVSVHDTPLHISYWNR